MILGKVIKSNGHVDYVCQIYGPGETALPPAPEDYAFGTFVRIALPDEASLIGLVYDTILMNPEFGNLGPRLSPSADLEIFSPDYLREKVVLVGLVLGCPQGGGIHLTDRNLIFCSDSLAVCILWGETLSATGWRDNFHLDLTVDRHDLNLASGESFTRSRPAAYPNCRCLPEQNRFERLL